MESREDHQKWLELRDTHAAALIRHEVIEKGRRALVVYGIMHLQRRNLFSNYELVEDPNVHTLVQQLEREGDARVFTVWPTAGVDLPELQPDVASWRAPSLALGARHRARSGGLHRVLPGGSAPPRDDSGRPNRAHSA